MADVGGFEEELALEVGKFNTVGLDDTEMADTACGKIAECGAAEATGTDDEHGGRKQFFLSGLSDFGQDDVAGIAAQIVVGLGG